MHFCLLRFDLCFDSFMCHKWENRISKYLLNAQYIHSGIPNRLPHHCARCIAFAFPPFCHQFTYLSMDHLPFRVCFSNAYVYMCRILAAIVFLPSILNFMQHAQCSCINELSQLLCVSHHFASDLFQWKLNAPIYLLAWFRRMLSFCDTPHTWKSASFPCNNWRHFRKMHYNIWKLCCNTKIPHIVLELRKAFLRFVFINSHFDESLLISAQHTWTHTHMQCLLQPFVVVFSQELIYTLIIVMHTMLANWMLVRFLAHTQNNLKHLQ